jgi:hypothetical protein
MSYCVNCGVKLNKNVDRCPLCSVEVINPADPINHAVPKKHPQQREPVEDSFDKNLWIKLVSIILAAPALVSITINGVFGNALTWSLYVAASLGIAWVWLVSPFLYKRNIAPRWITIDALALLGFLFLIEYLSPSHGWFFPLALPITSFFTVFLLVLVILIRQKVLIELHIAASLFTVVGLFCVFLNGVINLYALQIFRLDWSLLVLIPCIAFTLIAVVLQRRRWIVEELKFWFRV